MVPGPPLTAGPPSVEPPTTTPAVGPPAVGPPAVGPLTVGALATAVLAVSSSGSMVAYAAAPALAIAFWRNAIAAAALAPVALLGRGAELAALVRPHGRRPGRYAVLAGLALAVHFGCWVPSAKLTTVAASTALAATMPVWQGLIALGQGRRLPALAWLGIAATVAGAALATGADLGVSTRAVLGDVLAIIGGLAGAVYLALGERVRASLSTTTYTTVCYTVCAASLLAVCLAARVPLAGYPTTAWLAIGALTLGPQLMGHSLFNFALRRVSATTISVVVLLEVPGAALVAWAWLGQLPGAAARLGLVLLIVGVAVVILASSRRSSWRSD